MLGYLCCKSGVKELSKQLDYRHVGGTALLGIRKPVIKAHGSSDRLAFCSAIRQAMDAVECNTAAELESAIHQLSQWKEQRDA